MAREEKKITKFTIGRFTNGAYVLFGFILKGNVYGFIINKSYWNNLSLFSFVSEPEFYSDKDRVPHFLRKINWFNRFFFAFRTKWAINRLVNCLDELSDIPQCAWKYKDFINNGSRTVLFEKYGRKEILKHFQTLNRKDEFDIINIIIKKYGKKIAKEVLTHKPIDTSHVLDLYNNNCPVQIPSLYNKDIYVVFNWTDIIVPLFERFVTSTQKDNGVDKDYEYLKEIIK